MVQKPRLLLVGHTYAVSVNRAKARALAQWFEVMVCAPDLHGIVIFGQQGETFDTGEGPPDYVYQRLQRWPRNWGFVRFFLRGLGRKIADFRPDYVLCEAEPWSFLRWQAWCSGRWSGGRRLRFVEFTWENVRRPGWRGYLLDVIYRAAAMGSDGAICGNARAASFFQAAGMPEERILVTGQLGISAEEHPVADAASKRSWRQQHGFAPTAVIVGFCGRWVPEKGIRELLEAMDELQSGNPDLHLVLMGNGAMEGELQTAARSRKWLRLLPPVPNAEVAREIRNFDVLVLPSKAQLDAAKGQVWEEQFGHILLEAMTCGVPALGSRSGAIPEVLERGDVLCEPSSAAALKSLLGHWLGSPQALEQLGQEQRKATLIKWSHEALAERYAAFIRTL